MTVRDRKPRRFDDIGGNTKAGAGAQHRSGILRNIGLIQCQPEGQRGGGDEGRHWHGFSRIPALDKLRQGCDTAKMKAAVQPGSEAVETVALRRIAAPAPRVYVMPERSRSLSCRKPS